MHRHQSATKCSEEYYASNVTYFTQYYQAHKHTLPLALWRDSPVQHFQSPTGDYEWPIPGDSCAAIDGIELQADNSLRALNSSSQVRSPTTLLHARPALPSTMLNCQECECRKCLRGDPAAAGGTQFLQEQYMQCQWWHT